MVKGIIRQIEEDAVESFISELVKHYEITEQECHTLYRSMNTPAEIILTELSVADLRALCKRIQVPTTGVKTALIDRLQQAMSADDPNPSESRKDSAWDWLAYVQNPVKLFRNQFGNFEEPTSHLVFDVKTRMVKGKQGQDGSIIPLSEDELTYCREQNFCFIIDSLP